MLQIMIANLNGKPVLRRTGRQPARHRPRAKDAVLLQTQIEVMLGTAMLVQDERGTVPRIGGHAGTVPGYSVRDDVCVSDVEISGESIPLGAFLKLAGVIESGGDAKQRIANGEVSVNGETEIRRGRKLHRDDVVALGEERLRVV
jgi:ribosome-associated protein